MKPDEINFVADMARAGAGLRIDREKVYLIESRLTPVARREGFGSIREMLLAARQKRDEKLMWAVVEALAAGETWFFRDRPQFDRFRDDILPALARGRPAGQAIRVWSAGCGSGQEPYSLAFMVEDAGAAVLACGVDILGSDICERALEKAQAGLYSQVEVQRGLPIRMLVRHFEKREDLWEISPRVRAMVCWRRVNLHADFRALGRFEVIFCRQVLSVMDPDARAGALERLSQALTPGGYLVLGPEETAGGLGEAFVAVSGGLYRRNPAISVAA